MRRNRTKSLLAIVAAVTTIMPDAASPAIASAATTSPMSMSAASASARDASAGGASARDASAGGASAGGASAGGASARDASARRASAGGAVADPALQTVPLVGGRAAAARLRPFSLLGVTWDDPRAALTGTVRVRTRAAGTGRWSPWHALESDGPGEGDRRGASDPLWVGPSDAVQSRIEGALPAGVRLDLINPEADRQVESRRAATRPAPRMVTRAGWGANESIVRSAPHYTGPVEVFFVHHTATGNGYSCAQSAGIVRGIQAYQVRSRGWDDIGYNFLVDKCGTVFEGRAGGAGRSVLGAHTLGFNQDSSAIAVIGNYDSVGVSAAVRVAIATVAAYKLGAYGNSPAGRVTLTSAGGSRYPSGTRASLFRISGHRDAGRTACPGDVLYAQLPAIRAIAGAAPAGLRLMNVGGATGYGTTFYTRGPIRPLWAITTPSSLIERFEVFADGSRVQTTSGAGRTAALSLPPGVHTVAVRAVHFNGRVSTVTTRVVADPAAPDFTSAPEVALRPGSMDGSVPVRLVWTATDGSGLASQALTSPEPVAVASTARDWFGEIPPSVPTRFTVRAVDRAGNPANASVTRTPVLLSEAAARLSGTWRTMSGPSYLGGAGAAASAAGSSATWTFTGRSVALSAVRGPHAGRVRIFVDDVDRGLLDLRSAPEYRQAVWSRWLGTDTEHTVRVEIEGTPGRPGVILDGLAYLK